MGLSLEAPGGGGVFGKPRVIEGDDVFVEDSKAEVDRSDLLGRLRHQVDLFGLEVPPVRDARRLVADLERFLRLPDQLGETRLEPVDVAGVFWHQGQSLVELLVDRSQGALELFVARLALGRIAIVDDGGEDAERCIARVRPRAQHMDDPRVALLDDLAGARSDAQQLVGAEAHHRQGRAGHDEDRNEHLGAQLQIFQTHRRLPEIVRARVSRPFSLPVRIVGMPHSRPRDLESVMPRRKTSCGLRA